jgi:hypothetical protein
MLVQAVDSIQQMTFFFDKHLPYMGRQWGLPTRTRVNRLTISELITPTDNPQTSGEWWDFFMLLNVNSTSGG